MTICLCCSDDLVLPAGAWELSYWNCDGSEAASGLTAVKAAVTVDGCDWRRDGCDDD